MCLNLDKSYYIFEVQTNEVSIRGKITEFSGLPNYIDEVVVLNNVVLVFKNWYFYQIDIENFKGVSIKFLRFFYAII